MYPEDESIKLFETEVSKLKEQKKKIDEIMDCCTEDSSKMLEDFKSKLTTERQKRIFEEMKLILKMKDLREVSDELKEKLKNYDYSTLAELGRNENEKLTLFFYSQGGIDSLKRIFKLKAYTLNFRKDQTNFTIFIHLFLSENNKNVEVL